MGAISGEELMQETTGSEEKILVSVRVRPLNEKEILRNDVSEWECINDNTIICRNSLSVAERSLYPSIYTFDRVFSGDCSTRKVYEEGAREVALSVVSGVNSTVFAYGQTSSGKTHTMTGVTEYTVADIYDYIQKHTEREFFLKFSAIEIYNESVRDLLSIDSTPLRLLDDPEKGTTVEKLTEETLRDWDHLKQLLSICEAQRQIGETSLNEASSRSHQILRLTIESSAREFLGNDKSSSLTSTVNFVDLAGSERASQSLSAGARLKEGCHINRSLLTLGTVIRKLSKGRNGHIPFRDSKLTRILQSSLGGNSRTAIICTMSPARIHVEQSRNTLFFASCAKEVVTNAQVNVVVSDKALVKQLQRELARLESELRSSGQTPTTVSTIIREKDLQIEQLKKELRELTLERDQAWSQVKDLRKLIEEDEPLASSTKMDHYYPKLRVRSTWELENHTNSTRNYTEAIVTKNSEVLGGGAGSFDASQYSDGHSSQSDDNFIQLVEFETNFQSGKSPSQVSATAPSLIDHHEQNEEEIEELSSCVNSEDLCKVVRCIEMEESSINRYLTSTMTDFSPERYVDSATSSPEVNTSTSGLTVADTREENRCEPKSSPLNEHHHKLKNFIPFYSFPSPEKPSPWIMEKDICSSRGLKLTRSRSCKASLMRTLSINDIKEIQGTPPIWFEKNFTGRPEGFQKNHAALKYDADNERLTPNYSHASPRIDSRGELKAQDIVVLEDGKSADLRSSFLELEPKLLPNDLETESQQLPDATNQISKLERDDQVLDSTKQPSKLETEVILDAVMTEPEIKSKPMECTENAENDVGVEPVDGKDTQSISKWSSEFKRLQNDIIKLWHECNVSLVHRTYFFLLFKGDPADSIYMEVEFRQLSYLNNMFSLRANQTVEDGVTSNLTPALSIRALRRERQMLSKLMQKRLSKEERERVFVEWGIELNSSNRRLQLAELLWNDTKDMDHIRKSCSIVAKLVNYVQPNQALKEMFGLNFIPQQHSHKGSPRWIHTMRAAIL